MMNRTRILMITGFIIAGIFFLGNESAAAESGARVDSRFCTILIDPDYSVSKIERKISIRGIRTMSKPRKMNDTPEGKLGYECDVIFKKAEELLDMYPPGIHVTIKVVKSQAEVSEAHMKTYRRGTKAAAIYLFDENTIYVYGKKISESVLAHEIGHVIIDHYFGVRPPRRIEEMLAMYVDEYLKE